MRGFYGKYRAIVRDTQDPLQKGRIRVECPYIYGPEILSPWALPCLPFGGFTDGGIVFLPPEGAGVWLEFENGDPQYPIWSGFWMARPEDTPELPKELQDGSDKVKPALRVLKSTKGHTILFDDSTGNERLMIIDRAGNTLSFSASVTDEEALRELRTALNNDGFTYADLDGNSLIELVSITGQKLRFVGEDGKEKIELRSKDLGNNLELKEEFAHETTSIDTKVTDLNSGVYIQFLIDLANTLVKIDLNDVLKAEFLQDKNLLKVTGGGTSTSEDGKRLATLDDVKEIWDFLGSHTHIGYMGISTSLSPGDVATTSAKSTAIGEKMNLGGAIRVVE